ncbi:MAG: 2-amino-4-hydroxy-6-hydroxymethyldihydropteridine diphosphokinase [Burkholderiales bacterium]|jgi:2-amino-4-hydroxy-6-hydroxymethyldihydropteridine diphosphokinase
MDAPASGTLACLGLGANLGDPAAAIASALAAIERLPDTWVIARSSLWRSAPVLAEGPDFINAVAVLRTGLAPLALLDALQAIELAHGRERPWPNAPRLLDLDLLLHGDAVMTTERLTLPHPRMHQRAFVLAPLAEVAPALTLPGLGPVGPLLAACAGQRCERLPADPAELAGDEP